MCALMPLVFDFCFTLAVGLVYLILSSSPPFLFQLAGITGIAGPGVVVAAAAARCPLVSLALPLLLLHLPPPGCACVGGMDRAKGVSKVRRRHQQTQGEQAQRKRETRRAQNDIRTEARACFQLYTSGGRRPMRCAFSRFQRA